MGGGGSGHWYDRHLVKVRTLHLAEVNDLAMNNENNEAL